MLQQTSTARVVIPWAAFLAAYPTPGDLADAPLDEVLVAWRGLGYPRRARALREAAILMRDRHGGRVPRARADLLDLPGVGEYTASAVASFAFGEAVTVLDTNVGRVLARAVANARLTRAEARALGDELRASQPSADFNQSLLDLGAQFCRARPRCESCPLASSCRWRREGGPDPAPASAAVSRPQSAFAGSNRQLRGRILARLESRPSAQEFTAHFADVEPARLDAVLEGLARDGLVDLAGPRLATR
ncbi:MAG: A/G-specific adenine glycosylase [Acidobacteriota bacterium]|nr:A/G-specific adenine glycosylase [Acidobacteriota bacterium]